MYQDLQKEHLLNSTVDPNYENTSTGRSSKRLYGRPSYNRAAVITLSSLLLLLLGNGFLLREVYRLKHAPDIGRSRFSGLGYDHPVAYQAHSDYSSSNDTLADSLWESIDSSPIIVALTDSYAVAHNLEISARFPWDNTKGIYHKNLRKAYSDMHRGNAPIISADHVYHCMDTLLQDVMCLADDTPMPTVNAIHQIGNGQIRQCRNLEKLVAWTQKPERHACYRMLDEYRKVPHTLEEFAFCDRGSKYRAVAERYFQEHGHKDPYGD